MYIYKNNEKYYCHKLLIILSKTRASDLKNLPNLRIFALLNLLDSQALKKRRVYLHEIVFLKTLFIARFCRGLLYLNPSSVHLSLPHCLSFRLMRAHGSSPWESASQVTAVFVTPALDVFLPFFFLRAVRI